LDILKRVFQKQSDKLEVTNQDCCHCDRSERQHQEQFEQENKEDEEVNSEPADNGRYLVSLQCRFMLE